MEILLWLVPAAVVTIVAMLGVAWWGREGRSSGTIDRDEATRRLGAALSRDPRTQPGYAVPSRAPEPPSGVALRAPTSRPVVLNGESDAATGKSDEQPAHDRRAS